MMLAEEASDVLAFWLVGLLSHVLFPRDAAHGPRGLGGAHVSGRGHHQAPDPAGA